MKVASLAAGLLIVGLLSGCAAPSIGTVGSDSEKRDSRPSAAPVTAEEVEENEPQDLIIDDLAFGRVVDQDYWWYVVVVDNPNPDFVFASASLNVEALDPNGVILDTSGDYPTLLPGKTAITGLFFEVGSQEIVELNVRGPLASSAVSSPSGETGSFTLSPVESVRDTYSTTVSGNITSNFSEEQEYVTVVVVARGADGSIVGGESTYVERLPSGGTARFEASFFGSLPEGATFEAFPYL
ncbi:FxLYD domain-containing protein [Naasia sp. SYSU D00948]|uniref:FxLYD domain-containing protein n=1 Tax=Naasia sp. SYSU D00948 TaxID=2817379 RepID=UPI001B307D56|nr:FxLYD domain-containing protein [Naasia sp. SYSU D00948]